jgi:aryl-alcohol dehydrogenase-like predicted oxidoreductase
MQQRPLGRSGISVPSLCLGTMTWGEQNTRDEGHAQIRLALDHGLTFWDTAEMYAVPPRPETYGRTEEIIGDWFATHGGRDQVVLASKIMGRANGGFHWIRGGQSRLDAVNLTLAVEASLRRLQTDYIDLYQIHWPARPLALFGKPAPACYPAVSPDGENVAIGETLLALDGLVRAGKIRMIGVSNETAWGCMQWLWQAERQGLSRIVSIQNAYSLLNRSFETDLAEVALQEDVGLLAYSPLAAGTLTGKYLDGARPAGCRRTIDPRPSRYDRPGADTAVRSYHAVARQHGLDPVQMAVAFVTSRPFVTAAIIGATRLADLAHSIDAADLTLSAEVIAELEAVHHRNPNPCP